MPSLNVFNNDVAQASLAPPAKVPERYAELWWWSGSYVSTTSATNVYLQKGTTTLATVTTGSAVKLSTLNASWNPNAKYALEISSYTSGSALNVSLYDMTSGSQVSGSSISSVSGSGNFAVLRSGQFTLTPGHQYGITMFMTSSSYTGYLTDASLIIFS